MVSKLLIVHGGELAKDVAERIAAKKPAAASSSTCITDVTMRCGSDRPRKLVDDVGDDTLVCFVLQTIENAAPTEEVRGSRYRTQLLLCVIAPSLSRVVSTALEVFSDLFILRSFITLGIM